MQLLCCMLLHTASSCLPHTAAMLRLGERGWAASPPPVFNYSSSKRVSRT